MRPGSHECGGIPAHVEGGDRPVFFRLRRDREHSNQRRRRSPRRCRPAPGAGSGGERTMSTPTNHFTDFLHRRSFVELNARERANALVDAGTGRELLGPFDRIESPWLAAQGVTPQADDGCIVVKGKIAGRAAVVAALEGAFQGGSMGEVSGAKMIAALQLAR